MHAGSRVRTEKVVALQAVLVNRGWGTEEKRESSKSETGRKTREEGRKNHSDRMRMQKGIKFT